ncbi:uncharacterized protein PV06_01554 [Exophiala oligosperma]|uniref:Uncharacterized protein n=1 Tax=Exophiala oligosperma TaxID=215243 RepID=A0A0D2DS60_9EURO|nr:uncharacterized protein PV06_01554 [Exophiala oligosperma]KIW45843.1 hypothetical protein PV06_01554 [Exophiala oligosperma]
MTTDIKATTHSFNQGAAMLVIWGSLNPEDTSIDENALNAWWTNEHLPERLAIPGFHRTRRYFARDPETAASQYLVCYEVSALSTLTSPDYMEALNNPTPGTKQYMPVLASMNRSACNVLFSVARDEFDKCSTGVGATIAHIVFYPPRSAEARTDLGKWIQAVGWPSLAAFPSSLALHLLEHDDEATKSGSSTKSYDEVRFQADDSKQDQSRWMVIIEFAEPIGAPFGKASALTGTIVDKLDEIGAEEMDVRLYGLICAVRE